MKITFSKNGIDNAEISLSSRIGIDGASAYQIALDNGFEGTQAEWLASLSQPAMECVDGLIETAREALSTTSDMAETASKAASSAKTSAELAAVASQSAQEASALARQAADNATVDSALLEQGVTKAVQAAQSATQALGALTSGNRYSGLCTDQGYCATTNEAVMFDGDVTIEYFFRTSDDITTLQGISRRGESEKNISVDILNNELRVFVGDSTSIVYYVVQPAMTYHLIVKYDSAANQSTVIINGVMVRAKTCNGWATSTNLFRIGQQPTQWTASFKGVVYHCRIFNYLTDTAMDSRLWNGGRPQEAALEKTEKGAGAGKCIAEYLPSGITDNMWIDSCGGSLDLIFDNSPVAIRTKAQTLDSIVIESGTFHTNIEQGTASKAISLPRGYCLESIVIDNHNAVSLTGVSAAFNGVTCAKDIQISPDSRMQIIANPTCYSQTNRVTINAGGNTTTGGMNIRVLARFVG